MRKIFILAASAALAGCMVGPDYKEASKAAELPKSVSAKDFARADASTWKNAAPADSLPKGDWWRIFGDKKLDALLVRCCKNNPDLAAAFYRVEQAREAALLEKSGLYPHVGGRASYSRVGTSDNAAFPRGAYNDWLAGFGLTWDLDLFGRVRSLLEADVADAQALHCEYQNLMLNLQANVAKTYFGIKALNSEIAVLERTLAVRKADTELVRQRVAMDYSTNIDLKRAIQQEHEAGAQLAACRRGAVLAENMLALLVGSTPGEIGVKFGELGENFPRLPKAVPSELLERRPDIAAAERRVYAANARIGAAQAAFYPTISLTANADLNAAKIEKLISAHSFAWGVSPQLYIPIFEAGRNVAKKRVALAAHKEALENYKAKVLAAFKSVEDSLSNIKYLEQEYVERKEVVAASQDVQRMTRVQYDEGYTDYFSVSDAQRLSLANERALIVLRGDRFNACVDLILALGGGWSATPPDGEENKPGLDKGGRDTNQDFGQDDILPAL